MTKKQAKGENYPDKWDLILVRSLVILLGIGWLVAIITFKFQG